jgi:hypothetical protein
MIDDDRTFLLKNLALYNAEQHRRLTGNLGHIDQSHLSKKNNTAISFSDDDNQDQLKPIEETSNSDIEQFFHNSDLSSMTPESQSLLDDMFSS